MKAVFLDRSTFSEEVELPKPKGITEYQVYDSTPQNNETDDKLIVERCQNADIVITNKVLFSREILKQLPNLKLIQLTATGMNNVDVKACEELGVMLKNVAGYAVKSVPEHTFMLMLHAMRASKHYHKTVSEFEGTINPWQASKKFCLMDETIYDLEGKTLGIIGMGTIGRRVAEIAKVFRMTVLTAERQGKKPRNNNYTEFNEVLAKSDIISLHCPLTENSKHLINTATISKMCKKPLIVNVARGGVVNSQEMAKAVENGDVFGYASDVFEVEPMTADDPLLKLSNHPRVLFTPHNAWGSLSAQAKLWEILCLQVEQFVNDN